MAERPIAIAGGCRSWNPAVQWRSRGRDEPETKDRNSKTLCVVAHRGLFIFVFGFCFRMDLPGCLRQHRQADSGSNIHQPGYKGAASSLGFCEAKLRSFPPTAKSGLGQVAKGVPVGHGPLKWTPYPCGDVVPQNPLRGIRIHCVGFDPTMPSEKRFSILFS